MRFSDFLLVSDPQDLDFIVGYKEEQNIRINVFDLFAGQIIGSGTPGYVPLFTASNAIDDSVLYQDGSNIVIGGEDSLGYRLAIAGSLLALDGAVIESSTPGSDTFRTVGEEGDSFIIPNDSDESVWTSRPIMHAAAVLSTESATLGQVNTAVSDLEGDIDILLNLKVDKSSVGEPNGVASLDATGKIPLSEIPDSIIGQVEYMGTWDAFTNTPTLNPLVPEEKGHYYVVSAAGVFGGVDYQVGDWIISNGVIWEKVDNTDAVTSVFGRIGAILALEADYQSFYPRLSQAYDNPTWINSLAFTKITGVPPFLLENQTITLSGDVTGSGKTSISSTISNNAVSNEKLRDSVGTSVIGRAANSTGDPADIQASTDGHVLLRLAGNLLFGLISSDSISSIDWSKITGTPTTLSGYGITDAYTKTESDNKFVPYTGANANVNLGSNNITANSFIKAGGTSSQFLKADGSVDLNHYVPTTRSVNAGTGLTGGGNLSSDITIAFDTTWGDNRYAYRTRQLTINGTTYDLSADRTWNVGTVTSVGLSAPTGFAVSNSPVISSGTLELSFASGYSLPTNAVQANWNTAYNDSIVSAAVTGTTTKTLTLNQQDGGTITASWSDIDTAPVTSVFGRLGDIVAQLGDYNTSQVTENTNLYFTDARSRAAISLTTTGTSGASTYNSTTGVFNIPNYTTDLTGYVPYTGANQTVNLNTQQLQAGHATFTTNGTTDTLTVNHTSGSGYGIIVTKGGNNEALYVSKTSGSGNAMTVVGGRTSLVDLALSSVTNTAGDFLTISGGVVHKRTAAEVRTDIGAGTGNGTVTSVGLSSATSGVTIGSTPITTSGTITLAIATASGSQNGLLSSTNWTTFNSKIGGTLASGQVAFGTAANTIGGDNGLFWDNTNKYLGIGTNAPVLPLVVVNTGAGLASIQRLQRVNGAENFSLQTNIDADSKRVELRAGGSANGLLAFFTSNTERWQITSTGILQSNGAQTIQTSTGALTLQSGNRNVLINTTTDAGFRLDVNGTARVQGNLNVSTGGVTLTGAQTIQTSTGNLTLATAAGNGNIVLSPNGTGFVDVKTFIQIDNYAAGTIVPNTAGLLRILSGNKTGWAPNDELGKIEFYGTDTSGIGPRNAASIRAINSTGNGTTTATFNGELAFYTSVTNSLETEKVRIASTGNVLIQNGGTFTDAGFRLDVNGTGRFSGALSIIGNIDVLAGGVGSSFNREISLGSGTAYNYQVRANDDDFQLREAGSHVFLAYTYGGSLGTGTIRLYNNTVSTASFTGTSFIRSGGTSSQYLMADGSVSTLTNPVTGTGSAGQVAYWSSGSAITGESNLFWDATNDRLSIGTASANSKLTVNGSDNTDIFTILAGGNSRLHLGTATSGTIAYLRSQNNYALNLGVNTTNYLTILSSGNLGINTATPATTLEVNGVGLFSGTSLVGNTKNGVYIYDQAIVSLAGGDSRSLQIQAQTLSFFTGTTYTEKIKVFENGNVVISTSPSDAGFKLDVNGTGRFSGALNGASASFSGDIQTSLFFRSNTPRTNSVTIGVSANANYGYIGNDNNWGFRTGTAGDFNIDVNNSASPINAFKIGQTGAATFLNTLRVNTPNRSFFITSNAYSISDGVLSSGFGMDGDGMYLGNVVSSTGWTIANPQVTIRSSGNLGIGTPTPNARLHILNSSGGNTPSNYLQIEGSISDNSNYPSILFKGGTLVTTYPNISLGNGGLALTLNQGFSTSFPNRSQISLNNGTITLSTGTTPSVRFTINSSGSVILDSLTGSGNRIVVANSGGTLVSAVIGSGLAFDGTTLTATGGSSGSISGGGTSGFVPVFSGSSSISNSIIQSASSGITVGSGQNTFVRLGLNSGDWGEVQYSGGVTSLINGWASTSAYVQQLVNGQYTRLFGTGILDQNRTSEGVFYRLQVDGSNRMVLSTDGSANALIRTGNNVDLRLGVNEDAITIKNGGNVLIGTTTDNGNRLRVNGTIFSDSSVTASNFITTSDRRLKSEIKEIKNAISILSKFASYEYVKDGKQDAGFIAQEVKEAIPYSVFENNGDMLTMSDRPILAYIHKAILELNERINKLEK
jgi:hypothetical protein